MVVEGKELQGRILVIDDERGPRESLRMVLKYDYEIYLADRVDAGVELLREKKPDLIIMDIRMPEKSGIEGLQEIRAIDSSVSVIMLTGYGDLQTAQKAIRFGATDYLQKPFDVVEIQEVVKKCVDRSKLNKRKSKAQDEMQKMVQSLGREVGKTNKLTSLGAASAELVHDLRNPLTIIRGYLDLLVYELKEKREGNSSGMNDYLDQIEANVERCTNLVESWRALGRMDFSQMQRIGLPRLLQDCFHDTGHSQIAFSVNAAGGEEKYEILGEQLPMKRALQNVIDNAVTALEHQPDPSISVTCTLDNTEMEIKIRDNGCGMDMQKLRWIFEPLDDQATIEKGSGLGLFITKKVLEGHGGTLRVESRMGEGTIVTIRVPQAHTALGYFSRPDAAIQS